VNGEGHLEWRNSRHRPCGRGSFRPGEDGNRGLQGTGGMSRGPATAVLCSSSWANVLKDCQHENMDDSEGVLKIK